MRELYTYSQNNIMLDLESNSNQAITLDSIPTVKLNDADAGTTLATLTATQYSAGVYEVTIPFQYTTLQRPLQLVWSYSIGGVPINQAEYINVVTPYISLDDLRNIDALSEKSDEELISVEQRVRNVIDNFTGQSFGLQHKTVTVQVMPDSSIQLPERVVSVEGLYSSTDPTFNLWPTSYVVTNNGWSLTTMNQYNYGEMYFEDYIVTGPIRAPLLYGGLYYQPHQYNLSVTGYFGWQSVPADIVMCAKMLAEEYACSDNLYRTRGIVAMTQSNTASVEFSPTAATGTGNADVDRILSGYFVPRWEII